MKRLAIYTALALLILASIVAGCGRSEDPVPSPIILYTESSPVDLAEKIKTTDVEPDPDGARLDSVSFASDGDLIMISYRAPSKIVQNWRQGSIYIIDEKTEKVYDDIPVMPVIGPLFGKVQHDGQPGYVMLNNIHTGIKSGSSVTVVLGNYKRVHVTVK
jgi:hypothetical protein